MLTLSMLIYVLSIVMEFHQEKEIEFIEHYISRKLQAMKEKWMYKYDALHMHIETLAMMIQNFQLMLAYSLLDDRAIAT